MNKFKGSLLAAAMLLTGATCLLAVSCGDDDSVRFTFETNGGTAIEDVTTEKGQEYTLPTPVREGYSFEGWYTTPDFSGDPVTTVSAESSQTYYAKWEQMYLVTMNLNGGTLASSDPLYLKEGTNVYEAVASFIPTLSGCPFLGWYVGDEPLSETQTMTSAGITLNARYSVGYTVEVYLQLADQSGYEQAEDVTGTGYVGQVCTPDYVPSGYVKAENAGAVETLTLSSDASANVFKLYFDLGDYTITFHSNYPDAFGLEDTTAEESVKYGTALELSPDFFPGQDGYLLVGWATRSNGRLVYYTDFGDSINNDREGYPVETFVPSEDLDLYAVWQTPYTDYFGGEDYVYLPDENSEVVYLSRAGILFWGTYDSDDGEFTFRDDANSILLSGEISDNGRFIYYNADRAVPCTLFVVGTGPVNTTNIYFDQSNGITYRDTAAGTQSTGTYSIDGETGLYVASFTTGPLRGQTLTLLVGTVTSGGTTISAFQIRNEEEYNLGELYRFAVNDGSIVYYTEAYKLRLDGLGTATYNAGTSSEAYYYYTIDEEGILSLLYSNGTVYQTLKLLVDQEGFTNDGYMLYNAELDNTFTIEAGGTLETDGLYTAVYTNGDERIEGYFTASSSALGGYIVQITDSAGETHTYRAYTVEESSGETGETETTVRYVAEAKLNTYAEYYYLGEQNIYYAPLFVFDEVTAGRATLYGRTANGEYEKVSEGTYTYDEDTQQYMYVVDGDPLNPDVSDTPVADLSDIRTIVFGVSTANGYPITYWYSIATENGETTGYDVEYTSDGEGTLTVIGSFAIYRDADGNFYGGIFSQNDEGYASLSVNGSYVYFRLTTDGDTHTFVPLAYTPGDAYAYGEDGQADDTVVLTVDGTEGEGNASYTIAAEEEGGEPTVYTGTVTDTGETTESDSAIYHFASDELNFDFIYLYASSFRYFARYNTEINGEYNSGSGVLTLDGFSFNGSYVDADNVMHEGRYVLTADGAVHLTADDEEFYFDLGADKTFTVRGSEYGAYAVVENQNANGVYLEFDGYGNVVAYRFEGTGDSSERVEIGTGTYRKTADGYTVTYQDGAETKTLIGDIDVLQSGNYLINTFVIAREEVVANYLNTADWSVLYLDGCGRAVKYNQMGVAESGSYVIITENLLYYVNDSGSDACIYEYDKEAGSIVQKVFEPKGYYTADLQSMVFSKFGFMIFGGETRYYYNVEEDGNVTIYRQDATNELANDYGFVEANFGEFTDVKEFDEKTYYMTDGYAITFTRAEGDADKYPLSVTPSIGGITGETVKMPVLSLTFIPGGGEEFTVGGQIIIGEGDDAMQENCTVVREVLEDGTSVMYILLSNYVRLYIDVTYTGVAGGENGNTYTITDMRQIYDAESYTYLYNRYVYGVDIENTFGRVVVTTVFDEAGDPAESYVEAEFGESAGLFDSNGDPIDTSGHLEYTTYTVSSSSGKYSRYLVVLEGADGYTYRMHFRVLNFTGGILGYYMDGFTRIETLDTADGYTVEVERVVSTDNPNTSVGAYWGISLSKDGEPLESDSILLLDGTLYYVVRERDGEDMITSTIYYELTLVENVPAEVEEGETAPLPTYNEAETAVTAHRMTTIYDDSGESYFDQDENGEIILIYFDRQLLFVSNCTGDDETGYTVETTDGRELRITMTDGGALIVEI